MKKYLLYCLAIFIPILSYTQNTYEKGIGSINLDYAYAVTNLNNSIYITGANGSFTNQASSAIQVLKLDDLGNKIWDISIQAGVTQFAVNWSTSITATSTNHLLVGGYTSDGTVNGNKDGMVTKLDTNGNVIWSKRYGTLGQDRVFSVLEMNNGDYIVSGYQVVSGTSGSDGLFIIRTDTSGTIVWKKYFLEAPTTVGLTFLNGAIITNDDEIVATGFTNIYGAGDYDNFLIKLDSSGNTIFYKNYSDAFDNRMYAITALNNEYFLAGKSASATGDRACLIKTDSSGTNLWTHYYSLSGASINDFRAVTNDGNSIIATGRTDALGGGEAIIIKINPSNGTVESAATYGGNGSDKFYGATSYGASVAAVGSTTSTDVAPSTNGDMLVIRTEINNLNSCSGTVTTIIDTAITYSTTNPNLPNASNVYIEYNVSEFLIPTSFSVNQTCSAIITNIDKNTVSTNSILYPNPTSNQINLTIQNKNNEKVKISIFNSVGKKVIETTFLAKKIIQEKINTTNLINGIYLINIQIGSYIETKKIIIQR